MKIAFCIRDGQMTFLAVEEVSPYLRRLRGPTTTRRLSHIEPVFWPLRLVFRLLRRLFGDRGRVADWTRRWRCHWRVDFSPIGGTVHTCEEQGQPFADRGPALRYEYDRVLAWMAEEDTDRPPYPVDLVFRNRLQGPLKRMDGVLVCPAKQKIAGRQVKMTCERCRLCFRRAAETVYVRRLEPLST